MPFKGYKQTKDHKLKVRAAMGVISDLTRKKMGDSHRGKHYHSQEFKDKLAKRNRSQVIINKIKEKLTGRKWSQELRNKLSAENSHLWKGGITPINKQIRNSLKYKLWRKSVFERDNYTCLWCKAHTGSGKRVELQADHIKPFATFVELRFSLNNGRTLCRPCHQKTDTWGINLKNS